MSEKKDKPIHDEETLAKILEAAFVLQEHNLELEEKKKFQKKEEPLAAKNPATATPSQAQPKPQPQKSTQKDDQGFTLAQIVETQQQIRTQHLLFEEALSVIVERLTNISRASGAATAILDGENVQYRASAGLLTLPAGTEVPVEKALCAACLRSGKVFRCDDVNPELLLDTEACRQRGIGSLIAVPIFHNGGVAGALELYYPSAHAFADQDVHTGQLVAGLVTEALARNEEVSWKKSLATERAVMLNALEKLKPNLAALVDKAAAPPAKESVAKIAVPALDVSSSTFLCRKCGHQLVGQEQFCGNCGSPRSGDYETASLQSKVAALWQVQQAKTHSAPAHTVNGAERLGAPPINFEKLHDDESASASVADPQPPSDLFTAAAPLPRDAFQPIELDEAPATNELEIADFENPQQGDLETFPHAISEPSVETQTSAETQASTALVKRGGGTAWSSASNALDFLQQAGAAKNNGVWAQFWNTRRGDIYLAIAVVFVLGVVRWAIWSNHSVNATASPAAAAHRKAAPETDLSLFDRTLIKLGLAEAPEAPEYKGNPRTQVWVDLHTALYYCPGADLYGKTPKGRFSTQRDAQLDSFEPAYRKACD